MGIDCNKNHDEFVALLRASKRAGIEQLIKYLEMSAGYTVNNVDKGIYYVEGERIPIQIVVTSRLSKGENLWLLN